MYFDDGLLNLMSSTLFARFFLRLPRRSARTSLYLHSQSAAMVLRNITCGSAMLVNTQGVISVKQLTLLPGSLFNMTTLTSNIVLEAPSIANGTVLGATGSGDITLKIDSARFAGRISLYARYGSILLKGSQANVVSNKGGTAFFVCLKCNASTGIIHLYSNSGNIIAYL
ncbi:uncharacterized protein [Blastocystis hominis]|uniref:Adhesin domain-containing protein n=1 Tax=Blastocystis hominis TaxID=12968 RepID=D8M2S5_BLAHO|nr:uncharacterized protein [Blastocystis hominis]CBK22648.2 unnamed protein product [Blastocystis hominis]|eukprot:XP_012896696.1 uncharacterized protein [Blastocystis hominis]